MAIDPKFKAGPGGFYEIESGAGPFFINAAGVATLIASGDPIPATAEDISLGPGGFYINSTGAGPYAWDGVNLFMIGSQEVPESPFLKGEEREIWARGLSDIPEGWSFSGQAGDEPRVQTRENPAPDTWPAMQPGDGLVPILDSAGEPTGEYFSLITSKNTYIYSLYHIGQDGVTIIESLPDSDPRHSGFDNIAPISLPGGRLLVMYNSTTGANVTTTRKMDIFDLNTGLWDQLPDPAPGKEGVRDRYIAGAYSREQGKVFFARESGFIDTLDIDGMTWDLEVHDMEGEWGSEDSFPGVAEIVRVAREEYPERYSEALILGLGGSSRRVYVMGPLDDPYLYAGIALSNVEALQILSDPSSASQSSVWVLGDPEGDNSNRTLYELLLSDDLGRIEATVRRSVSVPWHPNRALRFDSTENKITTLVGSDMGLPTFWEGAPVRDYGAPYIAEIDLSSAKVKVVKE